MRVAAEIERLDQRQHLADGDGAGGGRRRAADIEAAIEHADRLAHLGAIVGEVSAVSLPGPRGSFCTAAAMSRAMAPS